MGKEDDMKKRLILVLCILTGLAWYAAVNEAINNPKYLAEHMQRAADYENQGIYVEAIQEYESALEYHPGDTEIMYKIAKANLKIGNSKQYIKLSKEIIESHPQKGEVLDDLINYYLDKKDKGAAVKYVAGLADSYPDNECARKWLIELKGSYTYVYFPYTEVIDGYNDTLIVGETEENGQVMYGIVDALGDVILPVEYERVQPFSDDGFALVEKDGQNLYVDRDGNTRKVPDMTLYESVSMINNARVVACKAGKFGLLDDTLSPKTDFIYEDISLPCNNLAAAKQNGKWALIGRSGKEKTEYVYEDIIRDEYGIASKQKVVLVQENDGYRIVNAKGENVGDLFFNDAKAFPKDGYAAVCQNGQWGFVDKEGTLMIDYRFEDARSFCNGYAAVCQNGQWGFVDVSGVMVIQPEFEMVTDMTTWGTAAVCKDSWRLIQLNMFR